GIFRCAIVEVSLQSHECHAGVAAASWRCLIHLRRNLARALSLLAWSALYESANRVGTFQCHIIYRNCGIKKIGCMISGVHIEVILAATYVVFLLAVAFALELLARHSHQRSESYRKSGFVYFRELDAWECPAGQQLLPHETHFHRKIVHYRAPA